MSDTLEMPHQVAVLLAWYRDMGVSAVLDDVPTDWRQRGDAGPGASFVMPEVAPPAGGAGTVAARPAHEPVPSLRQERPGAAEAPPAPRAPLPVKALPPAKAGAPVRSFAGGAAPGAAAGGKVKVEATTLAQLALELKAYDGCALKGTAKNLCLYRGAERARVMIIGEAPGREEDEAGRPFVGPAGQLLDRWLDAISLAEADVHITNAVYWRPPGNRTPTPQEALACLPFLTRQIELVGPDFILLAGGSAAKLMLGSEDGIMKVRGKWREIEIAGRKIKALATLHPAYALRAPASKRQVWRDLLMLKSGMSK